MRSYLNGMRSGRRGPAAQVLELEQHKQDQVAKLEEDLGVRTINDEEKTLPPIIYSTAPVLPPIPRIASTYGAQENLDLDELQRRLQTYTTEAKVSGRASHDTHASELRIERASQSQQLTLDRGSGAAARVGSNGQIRGQMDSRTRDQISNRVSGRSDSQVSGQTKDQIRGHQIEGRVRGHANGQVDDQIEGRVGRQIKDHTRDTIGDQITGLTRNQTRNQARAQIESRLQGRVPDQSSERIEGPKRCQDGRHIRGEIGHQFRVAANTQNSGQVKSSLQHVGAQVGAESNPVGAEIKRQITQATGLAMDLHHQRTNPASQEFQPSRPARSRTEPILTRPIPKAVHSPAYPQPQPQATRPSLVSHSSVRVVSTTAPPSSIRQSRQMFNRLNPMSLLGRRKSDQIKAYGDEDVILGRKKPPATGVGLPDNFDLRIRGSKVHDFSAPRPHRTLPSGSKSGIQERDLALKSIASYSEEGPRSAGHTPVFKEHFDDDLEPWRFDEDDRRNKSTGILDRVVEAAPEDSHSLPAFARNLPEDVLTRHTADSTLATAAYAPKEAVLEGSLEQEHSRGPSLDASHTASPPTSHSRSTSTNESSISGHANGILKRVASNASRFSFDFGGLASSVQEQILEEKHRQKNTQAKHQSSMSAKSGRVSSAAGTEDDFDYDDMDFDAGIEERIPGINADAEDESMYGNPPMTGLYANFHNTSFSRITSHSASMSNSSMTQVPASQRSEADLTSPLANVAGNAMTENGMIEKDPAVKGIVGDMQAESTRHITVEDDLYFDDGVIGGPELEASTPFDESVFDDETPGIYGLPLRYLPKSDSLAIISTKSEDSSRPISSETHAIQSNSNTDACLHTSAHSIPPGNYSRPLRTCSLAHRSHPASQSLEHSVDLMNHNLAAYHSALAEAANQAALDGRFDRPASLIIIDDPPLEANVIDPSVKARVIDLPLKAKVSFSDSLSPIHESPLSLPFTSSYDDPNSSTFHFSDDLSDDGIIAAANADALENDDDGFYGQEFGFFAHADATLTSDDVEPYLGGYFGGNGSGSGGRDVLKRSHSGKDKFAEPSLTPITELSEWSQRNSMVSLVAAGAATAPMGGALTAAPGVVLGLAQLAEMDYNEGSLSLSGLMKLRRGAWGGVGGSGVGSGTGASEAGSTHSGSGSPRGGSSSPSVVDSTSQMPTRTWSFGEVSWPPKIPLGVQSQNEKLAGVRAMGKAQGQIHDADTGRRRGHVRTTSADSVSYVPESGDEGVAHWVVEKRRLGEDGAMEILGRQVIEAGRI